mmetsp:Transcript_19399/g.50056  ORF Transcript_19399/g.50056 Transcript_19399/m.50056 type:complete len:348 (+) Transcript_19399:76-1119(+)
MKKFTRQTEAAAYIQYHWKQHRERIHAADAVRAAWIGHNVRSATRQLRAVITLQRAGRRLLMRRALHRISTFVDESEVGARTISVHAWPSVSLIQRAWRSHRLRSRWGAIISSVSSSWLSDDNEREAEFYTPAMMLRRERLWRSDEVQRALKLAWEAVSSAAALRHLERPGAEASLSWQQYYEISRKVYIVLMKRNDPREAFLLAKLDFERDTRNWPDPSTPVFERRVRRQDFFRSWFELADVNTDNMEASTYASFVDTTAHTIVMRDPASGAYMLRPDAEVYELVHAHTKAQKRMRNRLLAWQHSAASRSRGHSNYEAPTVASAAARRSKHEAGVHQRPMVRGAAG